MIVLTFRSGRSTRRIWSNSTKTGRIVRTEKGHPWNQLQYVRVGEGM